ncbi:uracil/xanthine transporter [Alicyclobacillus cycloheptanicus]|uniref:Xanthine/uracil permease n=1 Tax=Alicyclobacillus cycloheptanicus TaxID=1457 RepID=A0ABT9XFT6_9BACL|nr:uracil/xanthine transporter [Alicyclobacillus cycloheptanicus]MDQ0189164.1 xanthine/uracil permease [Alicyclobacillus cycloheptanicus]WDM00355.1 uracil/xanthine transporter [Alicyclobacillus cycloheptanicus]
MTPSNSTNHARFALRDITVTWFAAIQWLGFMFANTVVIPLSIGSAFHLSSTAVSGAMARSFIITGLACLLQGLIGHGLPLMEGQSGFWWGLILSLANIGIASGTPLHVVGGSMESGMVIGGIIIVLCGVFGLHRVLNRLFTPVVMAVLLLLLASQLVDIFFQGMLDVQPNGVLNPGVAGLSVCVAILVAVLTLFGRGLLSNFSILIGIALGWVAYALLIHTASTAVVPNWADIRQTFVWGAPAWNAGIVTATVLTALINTTNTIATLRAAEPLFGHTVSDAQYRRSFVLTGLYTAVSGPLSLVPYAPYTSSIGFLRTTRILTRAPYFLAAGMFVVLGLIPALSGFFSRLPISIGDAVLIIAYFQLFGAALQSIEGLRFNFKTIFRIAPATLIGLAILSTPAHTFSSLPGFAQSICANGMLVGILLAVILENVVPWKRLDAQVSES